MLFRNRAEAGRFLARELVDAVPELLVEPVTVLAIPRGGVPVAAPIAYVPLDNVKEPTLGRILPDNANHALYLSHLRRTVEEPFALFLSV